MKWAPGIHLGPRLIYNTTTICSFQRMTFWFIQYQHCSLFLPFPRPFLFPSTTPPWYSDANVCTCSIESVIVFWLELLVMSSNNLESTRNAEWGMRLKHQKNPSTYNSWQFLFNNIHEGKSIFPAMFQNVIANVSAVKQSSDFQFDFKPPLGSRFTKRLNNSNT